MQTMMIETDAGKRDNAKKRVIYYFIEGIFGTVSKDGKEQNRWSKQQNGSRSRGRNVCKGTETPENRGHLWNCNSKKIGRQRGSARPDREGS